MTSTLLVRIRFPSSVLSRLDVLGAEIRAVIKRRVSRASVIRALVRLGLDTAVAPEVAQTLGSDPVRRGRDKGCQQKRRARS